MWIPFLCPTAEDIPSIVRPVLKRVRSCALLLVAPHFSWLSPVHIHARTPLSHCCLCLHRFLPARTLILGYARSPMTDQELRQRIKPFLLNVVDTLALQAATSASAPFSAPSWQQQQQQQQQQQPYQDRDDALRALEAERAAREKGLQQVGLIKEAREFGKKGREWTAVSVNTHQFLTLGRNLKLQGIGTAVQPCTYRAAAPHVCQITCDRCTAFCALFDGATFCEFMSVCASAGGACTRFPILIALPLPQLGRRP